MKRLFALLLLFGIAGLGLFWWLTRPVGIVGMDVAASLEKTGDAARGEIVFNAGGCASCHMTPGQKDRKILGGGHEMKTPFGVFVVPNISTHRSDGIGAWSLVDLANSMLAGISPAGDHYYPAFPYASYAKASLADMADLIAYLRTLPAVEGKARAHDLAFPFNIRRGLGLWKALYLDKTPMQEDSSQSAAWNRGRYLVEVLGHCAECHSPRDALGGIILSQRHAGGPDPEGRGFVPNITPKGIGSWTRGDIAELLATGFTPDYDSVGSTMADVVKNTGALPKADRDAMAEYIKSLPPREGPPRPAKRN